MAEKKEEKKKREGPRCAKCGSSFVYVRIKDNSVVCRSCGYVSERRK